MKRVVEIEIVGIGTHYYCTAFKVGDGIERDTGYRGEYIAMIVWNAVGAPVILIDTPRGHAPWAIHRAGIPFCVVLNEGWAYVLNFFDEFEEGHRYVIQIERVDDTVEVIGVRKVV